MRFRSYKVLAVLAVSVICSTKAFAAPAFSSKFVTLVPQISGDFGQLFDSDCAKPRESLQISAYEVSNAEYAHFLNAVAQRGDPYELFSPLQAEHFWGGIIRSGAPGAYAYSVKREYARLPATFISWPDAMRYANWLHHGRPVINGGEKELSRTLNSGAYEIDGVATVVGLRRTKGARYFVPSCGEWRWAAFVDQRSGAIRSFATGDSLPVPVSPNNLQGIRSAANYYKNGWALPYPHLAAVDAYSESAGPSGTLNQAGNVMEWVESAMGGQQMALGGSLFLPEDSLQPTYRDSELPNKKLSSFGFRVARASNVDESLISNYSENEYKYDRESVDQESVTPRPAWVRVDRPGNFSDLRTGVGCVSRIYEIGRDEITNAEYAFFLNAVASRSDTYKLFVPDMDSGVVGGIRRKKVADRWVYEPKKGMANRPAAYLSWFAMARLANWMHYGMPAGPQGLGTTEGTASSGAYDTSKFHEFQAQERKRYVDRSWLSRNVGAKYFIPTDDEWYKAAYYDPERSGLIKYWRYPNRSNNPPSNALPDGANYQREHLGEGREYFVSQVGAFGAHGYYPVRDMAGNLWEWLESWRGLGGADCWRCDIPTKGLRGGSFNYIDVGLSNTNTDPGYPSDQYFVYGGRLARLAAGSNAGWCAPHAIRVGAAEVLREKKKVIALGGLVFFSACFVIFIILKRRH